MRVLERLGLHWKRQPGFRHYLHYRKTHKDPSVNFGGRQRVCEVAGAIGARVPTIYREFADPTAIDVTGLPDSFVVKPNCMWSAMGVMVLRRKSDGVYRDLLGRKDVSEEDIRENQRQWKEKWDSKFRERPFKTVVEEMVIGENGPDQIPYDYKCYTFNGEVKFILQVNRNIRPVGLAFFLNEFEMFDYRGYLKTPWKIVQRDNPVIPACAKQIVQTASTASRYLKTPFISVDVYASTSGPVLGELTRAPGGPYAGKMFLIKPTLDAALGVAWRDACDRLGERYPEVIDLGKIVPVRSGFR